MRHVLFTTALVSVTFLSSAAFAACTPSANISLIKPDTTYVIHGGGSGNGTVTDVQTGLMWKVCSEGQTFSAGSCTGTALTYTWKDALELSASAFSFTDWRLPNVNELSSLVDLSCSAAPRINTTIFPSTVSNVYWTATPYGLNTTTNPSNAWYVRFDTGVENVTTKATLRNVRMVRGGL